MILIKIDILSYEHHVQAHLFKFGLISFINKEMVTFIQLHTYLAFSLRIMQMVISDKSQKSIILLPFNQTCSKTFTKQSIPFF